MSRVGVVKSGSIKEFIQQLFGLNKEESPRDSIKTLSDVEPGGEIQAKELEELRKSEERVRKLEEKYRIEKFEVSQKSPKIKKIKEVKNIEPENEIKREEEQDQEMER